MAEYVELVAGAEARVMRALERTQRERDEHALAEEVATLSIQRQVRRHACQRLFLRQRQSCCMIERVFRGHRGRKLCHKLLLAQKSFEQRALFEHQALVIQHIFRGFHSRRYKHDFYARKAYIANIVEKSNQLRLQLAANRERAAQEEQVRRLREMKEEFTRAAQKLHHLVSTKAQPGVYNSPYALDGQPRAFGVPVEAQLRQVTTDMLREGGMRTVHRERRRQRKSLQASSQYGISTEIERAETRRSRTLRVSQRDFLAGGKGPMSDIGPVEHISSGTPYQDPWKVLKPSRDQPLKLSQRPFQTALPKNQLFDAIADECLGDADASGSESGDGYHYAASGAPPVQGPRK